jgi:hypothetical protein
MEMGADDYQAMKARLHNLSRQWGLWADDEIEEVARFVEHEIVHREVSKGKKKK